MKARLLLFAAVLFSGAAWSQGKVTGKVTDRASGDGLPGVAVVVSGEGVGVFTDADGSFSITADAASDELIFSFLGYGTERVACGGNSVVNVSLAAGVDLDEVVVTALGVSREKKALGYAVQELGNDAFTEAKTDNVVKSMTGKIAGVQVTSGTAIGSSSKIILRGASSITGDNQPLFVVDGVPMDNSDYSSGNQQRSVGGYDYGNAMQDLNPDDIESVTVLKGPAAAALYGSRASNGAIVLKTKTGEGHRASGKSGWAFRSAAPLHSMMSSFCQTTRTATEVAQARVGQTPSMATTFLTTHWMEAGALHWTAQRTSPLGQLVRL